MDSSTSTGLEAIQQSEENEASLLPHLKNLKITRRTCVGICTYKGKPRMCIPGFPRRYQRSNPNSQFKSLLINQEAVPIMAPLFSNTMVLVFFEDFFSWFLGTSENLNILY